jgi:hypothetical protein
MLKNVRYEDYEITYKTENRFQFMGNGYTHTEIDTNGDPVVWLPKASEHSHLSKY